VEQVPEVAAWSRGRALQTMAWMDRELVARRHIAGDDYSMADIVAQCACVLGKATGLRIPAELTNLSRWFADVAARPTARA
jgi:glutathione S-transferase